MASQSTVNLPRPTASLNEPLVKINFKCHQKKFERAKVRLGFAVLCTKGLKSTIF